VVLHRGAVAGFLLAHLAPGQREGRVEYPILPPEHTPVLWPALGDAAAFLRSGGATSVRVDLSEDRPDQHAVLERAGFSHRWTFVQMVKRLTRGTRIPVRVPGSD
jgi:hypothetical protein